MRRTLGDSFGWTLHRAVCVGTLASGLIGGWTGGSVAVAQTGPSPQWNAARPPATLDELLPAAPLHGTAHPAAGSFQAVSSVSDASVPSFVGSTTPSRPLAWRTHGMTASTGTIRLTGGDEPVADQSASAQIRQVQWAERKESHGAASPAPSAYADPFGDRQAASRGAGQPITLPGGAFVPAPAPAQPSRLTLTEPTGPPPVVIAPAAEWVDSAAAAPAPYPSTTTSPGSGLGGSSLLIAAPNASGSATAMRLAQDGSADRATAQPRIPSREETIPSTTPPEIADPRRGAGPSLADPLTPPDRPRPLPTDSPRPGILPDTTPGSGRFTEDLVPPGRERLTDDEIDQELERLRERLRQRQQQLERDAPGRPGAGSSERAASSDPCADQGERCDRATSYLLRSRIQDIALDTTPSFRVQPLQTTAQAESLQDALAKEPFRPWTGVAGTMIAEGRLRDYRNGQVFVQANTGSFQAIGWSNLSDSDRCYVASVWGIPAECRLPAEVYASRCWTPMTFAWTASALCHKPLYFEDVQLERYGHSAGPIAQPLLSTAHFFGNIAILPYNMGIHPPNECQYALGYYRPGSCAPYMIEPFPLSFRGALYQTAFVAGLITLLP